MEQQGDCYADCKRAEKEEFCDGEPHDSHHYKADRENESGKLRGVAG